MALSESLRFLITSDSAQARSDLSKLGQTTSTTMSGLDKLKGSFGQAFGTGAGFAGAQAGIAALSRVGEFAVSQAKAAIDASSRLEQSQGAVKAIFRESAAEVRDWGKQAAEAVGLSNSAFLQQAATLGALLQNLGETRSESAKTARDLIRIGADLAATFGGSTADAIAAIGSALRGERDPIERYGISIKEAQVQQKALQMGLAATASELTDAQKATAALALIQQQAASSSGAFARESDTLAGQQQRLNAEVENLRAELGTALLPAMTDLVKQVRDGVRNLAAFAENIAYVAREADKALGPVDEFIGSILRLPSKFTMPKFNDTSDEVKQLFQRIQPLQDALRQMGVDLKVAFADKISIKQIEAIDKAFQASGLSAKEFIKSVASDKVKGLPPVLAELISKLFGFAPAAEDAATSLDKLNKEAAGLSETMFGAQRAESSFFKATTDTGTAVGRTAKEMAKAQRTVDSATRSLADAQAQLQEAEVQRFLTSLGASSDEITLAQIAERDSTRSLADAKRDLAEAQERLRKLRESDAASLLDAEAANIEAQRALVDAERTGDAVALKRAQADLIRTEEALNKARNPATADELAQATQDVAAAQDNVTKAEIDGKTSRQELNDLINRGRDGSKELALANKAVEDAQRRVEDAEWTLIDATDALTGSVGGLSGATKDANQKFLEGEAAAATWLQKLIDNKATPEEFAAAVKTIRDRLGEVAQQAGQTDELDAYLSKMESLYKRITDIERAAAGASIKLKDIPGIVGLSGPAGVGLEGGTTNVELKIDNKTFGMVVVNSLVGWMNDNGAIPIRVR